jgi:hypothetical protein
MPHATTAARYDLASGVIHAQTPAGEPLAWRLHTPAHLGYYGVPGVIVGGPATGKTRLAGQLLAAIGAASIARWIATAAGGYPADHHDWLADTPRHAGSVIAAAADLVDDRASQPGRRYPLLVVVIDTTDTVLTSAGLIEQATRLVVAGPRVGISPILLANTAQLATSFGSYSQLRAAAGAHQVVNLSTDRIDQLLMPTCSLA